jgi:phenylalanyl-tRNA synthetase beta chain
MKISENWLRSWVNPAIDSDTLSDQLTMLGLEVDELAPVAKPFTGVVVGEVLTVEQHPDADRLRVTTINIGSGEPYRLSVVRQMFVWHESSCCNDRCSIAR